MTLEVLSRALPFRPEWIFSDHVPRAATPRSDQYCSHLITGQNVRDLMAYLPWNVLTANVFLIHGRRSPGVPDQEIFRGGVPGSDRVLGVFASLSGFTGIGAQRSLFHVLCRGEKASLFHAGARWKQLLQHFLITMREGWCDLDLLLDLYFLHVPNRPDEVAWYPGIEARRANLADPQLHRREPATLIEALAECDAADPWRTHYRLHHANHPARRIIRLTAKFFNVAALNPNAPPLHPLQ
ncbi:hypothetical protein PHMEG_0004062 [Phytophthora megakarya]|uniref:Uncharacterized protein n=1 Tax=Phytophthora megakarya TaxID=4795 RepID=A0A225WWC9_9STRA|nr:hypothetical protein PHMEG_0004062 [Phytophthora megakarya]